MKKNGLILVLFTICLFLVGCKSKAAQEVDEMILKIGFVSAESGADIEKAETYYDLLTDKQKSQVENYDTLLKAREEFDEIMSKVYLPSLKGKTEEEAIKVLEEAGLEYKINYDWDLYDGENTKGKVLRSTPEGGHEIKRDVVINLSVSKGPYYIWCDNAILTWHNTGRQNDDWSFTLRSNVETGELILESDTTFYTNFAWRGDGIGVVSLTEDFAKSVPVTIEYRDKEVKSGESQHLVIKAPLRNFNDELPTNVYYKLYYEQNGVMKEMNLSLSISWK